jgi:hypothetical protein
LACFIYLDRQFLAAQQKPLQKHREPSAHHEQRQVPYCWHKKTPDLTYLQVKPVLAMINIRKLLITQVKPRAVEIVTTRCMFRLTELGSIRTLSIAIAKLFVVFA